MNITKQTDPYKNNHHLSDRYKSSCSLAAFKEYGTLLIKTKIGNCSLQKTTYRRLFL